jgi:site-specific recombinase XerD
MIEDLQLRGLAPKTQQAYVRAVRQLAEHFKKSPEDITEEDLRQYFLYLKNVRHASRSSCTQALCGIKFFFEHTLRRDWKTFELVRPPKEKKLPVVLSQEEVRRVLGCLIAIYCRFEVPSLNNYDMSLNNYEILHIRLVPKLEAVMMVDITDPGITHTVWC